MPEQSVIPLESNPDIFSRFAAKLGVLPLLNFCDIFSLEEEMLAFTPQPVYGIILLFPITAKAEQFRKKEDERIKDCKDVLWLKQTVKNACGLYALLHILLNLDDQLVVRDSLVDRLKQELCSINQSVSRGNINADTSPAKKSLVENLATQLYQSFAQQGQTEAPPAEQDTNLHFISYVFRNGSIYELDGRRQGPVKLGESEMGNLVENVIVKERISQYMDLADQDPNFALLGLVPS